MAAGVRGIREIPDWLIGLARAGIFKLRCWWLMSCISVVFNKFWVVFS
jgi:hypothetical protein